MEYQGYLGRPNFHFIANAEIGLRQLAAVLEERLQMLRASGYTNIMAHNDAGKDFIQPIALFVDEIALLNDRLKEEIKRMIEYYGAAGLYPVLATNNPTKDAVLVNSNLSTRICFGVPSFNDSMTVLKVKGAEALTERGRGIIIWDGLTEFHTFHVTYPEITDEHRRALVEILAGAQTSAVDDQPEDKSELVKQLHAEGLAPTAIVYKIWGKSGSAFAERIKQVKEILATAATATASTPPVFPKMGQ